MAHQEAYNRAGTGHIFAHLDRSEEHISNPDIDRNLTHLNYNLAADDQPLKQTEFLKNCLEKDPDLYCMNRKDVNVICNWVFQVPKDLPEEEWGKFFECCRNFCHERYGSKYEISSWVHMDEFKRDKNGNLTQEHGAPHLNYCFIPVVPEKNSKKQKKHKYKVSHKQLITKTELSIFHDELADYLEREMGHPVHVHEHNTEAKGNLTVLRMKLETAEKERNAAIAEKTLAEQQKAETDKELAQANQKVEELTEEVKTLQAEQQVRTKPPIQAKKTITGKYKLSEKDFQKADNAVKQVRVNKALDSTKMGEEIKDLQENIESRDERIDILEKSRAEIIEESKEKDREISLLTEERKALKKELAETQEDRDYIIDTVKEFIEDLRSTGIAWIMDKVEGLGKRLGLNFAPERDITNEKEKDNNISI